MATIADLHKSISQLTDAQALELIVSRRESRRVPKKKIQGNSSGKTRKKKVDVEALFEAFNAKQQDEFLKRMERMQKK